MPKIRCSTILNMKLRALTTPSAKILIVILYLTTLLGLTRTQAVNTPCPDIFTYQADRATGQKFGYIEIDNINIGQVVKLNVDLTIPTRLPSSNIGSITLIKSREETFNDISQGLPAQYRVNFPLQNIIPWVLSIAVNGQTICIGSRAQGRVVTTINLAHTLYTQLHAPPGGNNNGFQFQRPAENAVQPVPPYRPEVEVPQTNQPWFPQPQTVRPIHVQQKPIEQRPVTRPAITRPDQSISYQRPERPPVEQTSQFVCGKTPSSLNSLSINGERVVKGQFPWVVPLFDRTQRLNPKYICGSTIITKQHLITAAHCVYELNELRKPSRLLAMPGLYNIDNFLDENAQTAEIAEIVPHEEYVVDGDDLKDKDVAVLRLKVELVFSNYIIPICLWQDDNDLSKVVGEEGIVAGWGITETGSTSSFPTFIRSLIVTRQECIRNLKRTYPSAWPIFCGDGRGSVPCKGDSGNGLVVKRNNQYFLRGVVSVGQYDSNANTCNVNAFTVYTDVALLRFWLRTVTG
ncbi:serine protease gd-like [Wyeomyia smithii]|uniref:serine protease gd-like n=1 Tax=Wyeomyia smithii TaxID=174621 RepID=UPI002467AD4A|nr:serine protease gd-like [Wyeomyia smithii]